MDRAGLTGLAAGTADDAPERQAALPDCGPQTPGRATRQVVGVERAQGACLGAGAAESAAACRKIDLRIAARSVPQDALGAGLDAVRAAGTKVDECRLRQCPRRTSRRAGAAQIASEQLTSIDPDPLGLHPGGALVKAGPSPTSGDSRGDINTSDAGWRLDQHQGHSGDRWQIDPGQPDLCLRPVAGRRAGVSAGAAWRGDISTNAGI